MDHKTPNTLYICYFGLREPLVQTQVIPYLSEILKDQVGICLLTFEPDLAGTWSVEEISTEQQLLKEKGITWLQLPYHKRPSVPATFYDILNGARVVRQLIDRENIDILHCRVHVPALMAAVARKFSKKKPKLIFDIRGFFPEEYTDAGVWPENGWLYRVAKRVEKWLLKEADGFVILTKRAREILFPDIEVDVDSGPGFDGQGRPVEVIPCCVDTKRFEIAIEAVRERVRGELGVGDRFVIAYVGSFGGWYLSDELFDLFSKARELDPEVFIMILTQRNSETVLEELKTKGFSDNDFLVRSVLPSEMPRYLSAADAGISFIKRCYSKQASSPTKNAEYLASGLPIIVNAGVGDVNELIKEDKVGVLVETFDGESYARAIIELKALGDIRQRCRESAKSRFDLEKTGGERYRRLYRAMMA
jgi:glycosyltransferase involved in cell wall biosynthesis